MQWDTKKNSGKQTGSRTQKYLNRTVAWEMLGTEQYKRR